MHDLSQRIHFNMAFIGGYLGVHAILSFSNLLGNAQTSNLISMVTSLLSGDWQQLRQRIGGMLLYMAAIALTVYLPPRTWRSPTIFWTTPAAPAPSSAL